MDLMLLPGACPHIWDIIDLCVGLTSSLLIALYRMPRILAVKMICVWASGSYLEDPAVPPIIGCVLESEA